MSMRKSVRFVFSTASSAASRASLCSATRNNIQYSFSSALPAYNAAFSVAARASPCSQFVRLYGSTRVIDEPAREVSYKEVKKIVQNPDPNVVVVDVREPSEYENGHIPNAINIPFKSMPGALGLDSAEFESTLGFPKPDTSKTLLFYCLGGVRSTNSEQLASTYGYRNRMNYKGSYSDWSKQESETQAQ